MFSILEMPIFFLYSFFSVTKPIYTLLKDSQAMLAYTIVCPVRVKTDTHLAQSRLRERNCADICSLSL